MTTAQNSRFFKIGEAAKLLGLSAETLRRWERAGRITFSRTPGGKRVFSEADLEAVRNLLKPTHTDIQEIQNARIISVSEYQNSGKPDRSDLADASGSLSSSESSEEPPKPKTPLGNLFNALVYILLFGLIISNTSLPSFQPPDFKKVLGVETAIIPAAQEGSILVQTFATRTITFLKSINPPQISLRLPSFNFPFLAFFTDTNVQTDEDLLVRIGALEEKIATLRLSSEPLVISDELTVSSLTTDTLLATTINTNTFDGNKLIFSGSSPSIYPSTKDTTISLNASGTGAINIGNAGTGDIYLAGGSGDSGCTLTNNNGTFNCSGNITSAGDLIANGGDILTDKTTLNLGGSSTTINIPGSLTIAGSTGNLSVGGNLTVSGTATFSSDIAVSSGGQLTLTREPTEAHTGTWAIGSSTWNADDATIYVNPASATADSNIFGLAVNNQVRFAIDAEGDVYANNLILAGNTTSGTTTVSGDLSVEGNTTLGDATTDTLTINPATVTLSGGNKILDIVGAATRTLTLLNSTASQIADLDLSDGNLKVGGSTIITNAGAGSFIGNVNSSSGALQTNGVTRIDNSGNLTAGTGAFSGNVTPGLDATYNFGSDSVRWLNGYFSGDVVVGDAVFKNDFRLTEGYRAGKHSIDMLNPRGEMIASFDENGNFWVKGEIKAWNAN